MIALSIRTDQDTSIVDWGIEPPFEGQVVTRDYAASEEATKDERNKYKQLFDGRLLEVLNGSRLLRSGVKVEGALCAIVVRQVSSSLEADVRLYATLTATHVTATPGELGTTAEK